jgi:hypothetical protein
MIMTMRTLGGSISRSGRGDKEEPPKAYFSYVEESDDAVNEVMDAKVSRPR